MIVVRDIFQLKFGKAKEAMDSLKRMIANIVSLRGYGPDRVLTDLTGQYYTLIMETTYNDLADYDQAMHNTTSSDDWKKEYHLFADLVESGRREIFNVVQTEQTEKQRMKAEATARAGTGR
ncbi:MAG TPA: hypothetical protein DCZ43_02820 [candidate division Zixibacteria bacterium]|nr:hypothetical protein [candidate division Zixibacteria bacterium]